MRIQFVLGLTVIAASCVSATTITVVSGNGSVGSADSQIHFLGGPANTDFGAFTPASFTSAQIGSFAQIINPHPSWNATIAGAQWIGDNAGAAGGGSTDLYAISFNVPTAFSSASISINLAVDNQLGGTNLPVYLNGNGLGIAGSGGFNSVTNISAANIQAFLNVGTNWLYIDAVNTGGPAGLLFSATITTVDAAAVPEPATWMAMATGLAGLAGFRRFRRP